VAVVARPSKLLLLFTGDVVDADTVGAVDEGVEVEGVVVWCPFGVGEIRDGVVVVEDEPPPFTTDSPSSESSLSYSTASLP
jgi:hypothetical protein